MRRASLGNRASLLFLQHGGFDISYHISKKSFLFSLLAIFAFSASAAAKNGTRLRNSPWASPYFQTHPLLGKIWSSKARKFVSEAELQKAVGTARFILLGETHTNKDHHRLQARMLNFVHRSKNRKPVLVVEMIPQSLGNVYPDFVASGKIDFTELGQQLKWEKRGWGPWENYQPIFAAARRLGFLVRPGNLDRPMVRQLARKGLTGVGAAQQDKWALNIDYTAAQENLLKGLLYNSHCKLMPKAMMSPLLLVQKARDGNMARQMADTEADASAVLIAGAGHVRRDVGVPRVLRALRPKAKIISIAFSEVDPDHNTSQEYEPRSADSQPVFDYLYFTPKSDIKDHCAELKKRFKHRKKSVK